VTLVNARHKLRMRTPVHVLAVQVSSTMSFEKLSPDEVCVYLKQEIPTIAEDILEKVVEHKIDGEVFLSLNDEYLREIAPLLGDRLKLKRVLNAVLTLSATVSPVVRVKVFV